MPRGSSQTWPSVPESTDAVALLKQLRKVLGGRGRSTNIMDANVSWTTRREWAKALKEGRIPSDHFRYELKIKRRERPVTLRASDRFVAIEIRPTGVGPVFSINRPNRLSGAFRRLRKGGLPYSVYALTSGEAPAFVKLPAFRLAVQELQLRPDESLHVYANGLTLYIRPLSANEICDVMDRAAQIAHLLPTESPAGLDLTDLPPQFAFLVPLIRRWAKSDDEDRAEALRQAPRSQRERLVKVVRPQLDAIDSYLDGFGDKPLPESAVALGTLAECALEATLSLTEKGGSVLSRGPNTK